MAGLVGRGVRLAAASTTETTYAGRLRAAIQRLWGARAWLLKVHGGPYQTAGMPDMLLCLDGAFIAIELKRPGRRLTPRQNAALQRILAAGGEALVITTETPIDDAVRRIADARDSALSTLRQRVRTESWQRAQPARPGAALSVPEVR